MSDSSPTASAVPMTSYKAWLAVLFAVLSSLAVYLTGPMHLAEWINVAIVGVTAVGVKVVRNDGQPWAKFLVAITGAALVSLASAVSDDKVTSVEMVNIVLAMLTAAGVGAVEEKPKAETLAARRRRTIRR